MTKAERAEKGKALLAEAGFGPDNPLKVTIESSTDNTAKKLAEGVALMWKQDLGVDAKVNAQEFQAWMDTFYAGGWDVLNDNLVGDMPGPESHLAYMRPSAESGYNWKNDEYRSADGQGGCRRPTSPSATRSWRRRRRSCSTITW